MEKIDPRHALEWLSINPQSWSALRLSIAQHLARERAEQMLRASERDSNMSKDPKRLSLQSALDAALADNAALVELLGRFARMHRDGSDPNELACRRGYSSDMTCLFSIDFENAHNAVENPHPGAALLERLVVLEQQLEKLTATPHCAWCRSPVASELKRDHWRSCPEHPAGKELKVALMNNEALASRIVQLESGEETYYGSDH